MPASIAMRAACSCRRNDQAAQRDLQAQRLALLTRLLPNEGLPLSGSHPQRSRVRCARPQLRHGTVNQRGPVDGPNASRLTPPRCCPRLLLAVQRCVMAKRTRPESSQVHFTEIKVDPEEARDFINRYLTATNALTARISPKRSRSRTPPPTILEIKCSAQPNRRDVAQALRAHFLERACDPCDCYYCRSQRTKGGQRMRCWVDAVRAAEMGDPSHLVHRLKTSAFTRWDRNTLAELLDAVFRGEIDDACAPDGRPKNIAARFCADFAIKFYTVWKSMNRQLGIRDWGHSDEMKDEACRVAIEYHQKRLSRRMTVRHSNMEVIPKFAHIRELMDRPRSRRR
jgi:hypothetical protein